MAGGHHGEWGRVTAGRIEGGGGAAINCHKMQEKEGRGRGRSGAVTARLRRRAAERSRGKEGEEEGREGADRRAPGVSGCEKKGKREKETWANAGRD
jgi:hypothetical protein